MRYLACGYTPAPDYDMFTLAQADDVESLIAAASEQEYVGEIELLARDEYGRYQPWTVV